MIRLPDEFEGTITLFNGKTLYSDPLLADTDVDGLYDGQEITCRIEPGAEPDEVYVFVWLHSDPNGDDSDGDGIPDGEDTAPFSKGLAGGIVGELTIVSFYNGTETGHSFLVYKSFINDVLSLKGINRGYDLVANYSQTNYNFSIVNQSIYSIKRNRYITFGAWAEDGSQAIASSGLDDITQLIGLRNTQGGIRFNKEAYDEYYDLADYSDNYSYSKEITKDQLEQLITFLDSNNYYHLLHHNCTTDAKSAWYELFGEYFGGSLLITISSTSLPYYLFPIYVDLPAVLKAELFLKTNESFDTSVLKDSISEEVQNV